MSVALSVGAGVVLTVMVVSSGSAGSQSSGLATASVMVASSWICRMRVPAVVAVVAVACTVKTVEDTEVTVPIVQVASPALTKSSALIVAGSMASLKVTV